MRIMKNLITRRHTFLLNLPYLSGFWIVLIIGILISLWWGRDACQSDGQTSQLGNIVCSNYQTPEAIIKADVSAQNNRDWSTFLDIRTAKSGPPESRVDWVKIKETDPVAADMMNNIIKAELVGIKPLPLDLVGDITRIDKFFELYDELNAYYVAIYYQVKIEGRGFLNGVNYRLYILGLEEGHWVIVQASEAPVHRMIEAGYGFGTLEEKTALEIQRERERKGK
jgi:hypothetical protein